MDAGRWDLIFGIITILPAIGIFMWMILSRGEKAA
jgi:hypothetical protein